MSDNAIVREKVLKLLKLMMTRVRWSLAKQLLSESGIHAGRGWDETIKNFRHSSYSDLVLDGAYNKLFTVIKLHTYVGNKKVYFFDLLKKNTDVEEFFINLLENDGVQILSERLSSKYNWSSINFEIDDVGLEKIKDKVPNLFNVELKDEKIYFQFFSARSYVIRESFEVSEMDSVQAEKFADYDKLIGVKNQLMPCFDVIVFDAKRKLVELRIDFNPEAAGRREKDEVIFDKILNEFRKLTHFVCGDGIIFSHPMNLYPVIHPMYSDNSCGSVSTLGFVAIAEHSTSNNHGKIHRKKGQDLRNDSFHIGGKKAVKKISPYVIGITWSSSGDDLYLELKGSIRQYYSRGGSVVSCAEFLGCQKEVDFDFLVDQILHRLPREKI